MAKAIPWKSLKHAHGPATKVPVQVKELLAAANWIARESTYWVLWETLVGRAAWFEASAPAVGLLLDTAAGVEDPTLLIVLAADIIGGDQLRAWLSPPGAPLAAGEKAVHEAAIDRKKVLFGALGAADGRVRGAAAMALAMLPGLAKESVPRLIDLAGTDADEIGRASAVLALGRLGAGDPDVEARIAGWRDPAGLAKAGGTPAPPGLVRGAAGLCWLRQGADRRFGEARAEVEEWLAFLPARGVELPWFKAPVWYRLLGSPDAPARALCALGQHRGAAGVDALTDFAVSLGTDTKRGAVEVQLAKVLLALGEFPGGIVPEVSLVGELTPTQQAMAKRLANTDLLPVGGQCLTASGAIRRRWIGLEPPGVLDQLVQHRGAKVPRWRAYQQLAISPNDFASKLDYWRAFVEFSAKSYPPFMRSMKPQELVEALATLPVGDDLLALVPQVADDLSARFTAAARQGTPIYANPSTGVMLLLPWVRSGKAVAPAWDPLVPIGPEPETRELFGALPLERREAILLERLAQPTWAGVKVAIPVLDLAPTLRVGEAAARAIDAVAKEGPMVAAEMREFRAKLDDLIRQHPGLGG